MTCHQNAAGSVLGLRTRYINKAITYPTTGQTTNQLVALSSIGAINQNITNAATNNYITVAAHDDLSQPLELRARSYLDVNCSGCHQPGTGNRAIFDARITTALDQQEYIDGAVISQLGLNNPKHIVAGEVDRSMIHFRMNSLQSGVSMPPISKNKIDAEGVQVIADWINSLGNTGGGTVTESCGGNTITHGNGTITLTSGGNAAFFKILRGDWSYVDNCGYACGNSFTVNGLAPGDYRVFFEDANYQPLCDKVITLGSGGGGGDPDNDGDGVPASQDCNDNDPNLTTVGASCNDGNSNTNNDVVQANCTCAGTPTGGGGTVTENCGGNTITHGNGTITLTSGGNASFFKVLDSNWGYIDNCGWNCGNSFTVNGLAAGQYRVFFEDANYQPICDKLITLGGGGGGDPDNDGDGIPASQDCNDNDPNLTTVGASCNDGNSNTNNDVVQSNCTCAGTPSGGGGTTVTEDCNGNTIMHGNGTITLTSNGSAAFYQILNSGYGPVDHCGWQCDNTFSVTGLPAGRYLIYFQNASYSTICEKWIDMTGSSFANASAGDRVTPHLSLSAFPSAREVDLQWLTNTSYFNDYFIVEKSIDGQHFEAIQRIKSKALGTDMIYNQTIDSEPKLGENYYRIKQVYRDGDWDYTDVQLVDFKIDLKGWSVFPNPAEDELFINLKPFAGKTGALQLVNNVGQVVQTKDLGEISGETERLDLQDVENGLYFINIKIDGQKPLNQKVIIERMY